MLERRRTLIAAVKKGRLPSEYQEVEYLESIGTQYINTNFKPNNNTTVKTIAKFNNVLRNGALFGTRTAYNSDDFYSFVIVGNENNFRTDFYNNVKVSVAKGTQELEIVKNKNVTVVNGTETINDYGIFDCNYNLFIFAMNNGGNTNGWLALARIYYLQIINNGSLVRNFIPCYRKSDSVAGMYDLVNNVFYTNAGTGSFIVGADVN